VIERFGKFNAAHTEALADVIGQQARICHRDSPQNRARSGGSVYTGKSECASAL